MYQNDTKTKYRKNRLKTMLTNTINSNYLEAKAHLKNQLHLMNLYHWKVLAITTSNKSQLPKTRNNKTEKFLYRNIFNRTIYIDSIKIRQFGRDFVFSNIENMVSSIQQFEKLAALREKQNATLDS